ncbi:MAG: DUF5702 domain-containing protein [Eubacteriales bacterium]|nr:DUF5702 domain-containing protein [Eubacteriales bacterium]
MRDRKGTISVFLSLISVLLISVLTTSIESSRIQGCRAKAAACLDMGLFSVMGEFERELLEHYDVFFLDGAAGSSTYSVDGINEALHEFMEYNVKPNKGMLLKRYDAFGLNLNDTKIDGVCFATDDNGQAFYQQAVGFVRENISTELISALMSRVSEGQQLKEAADAYKKKDENIAEELKQLEDQRKALEEQRRQEEKEAAERGELIVKEEQKASVPDSENPLKTIKKMKKKGILNLVTGDAGISEKTLPSGSPSKRRCQRGTLPVEKKYSGLTSDLLFQEYLFERFPLYTDEKREGVLDYGLEYILCGKNSDEKNLKSVVNRLLLLREGANFLYLSGDTKAKAAADALAVLLVGAIPVPGLTAVTAYALLLVWAYGESLLDVRELLAGGKVPVFKNASTWKLELESIPKIMQILENTSGTSEEGLSYAGYMQILFTLGTKSKYPMRALDLIEGYMRQRPATSAFRADHAICKVEAEADFTIPPLFLKVSSAFLKTGETVQSYHVSGSFAY